MVGTSYVVDDVAVEARVSRALRSTKDALVNRKETAYLESGSFKRAELTRTQAQKLRKHAPEKAITYMKKARAMYSNLLRDVKNSSEKIKVRTGVISRSGIGTTHTDFYKNMMHAVSVLESRIDACDAILLKWNDPGNRKSLAEIKSAYKSERKEVRMKYRESEHIRREDDKSKRNTENKGKNNDK